MHEMMCGSHKRVKTQLYTNVGKRSDRKALLYSERSSREKMNKV
jgi:hypothetical protein